MSCSGKTPLRGRASAPGTMKVVQLFGTVAEWSADPMTLLPATRQWAPWIGPCDGDAEGLYLVSSTASEIVRGADREIEVLNPVPRRDLELGVAPPGGTFARRSHMKLRVQITREDGQRFIDIDAGESLEFYAQQISVHRLTPAGWVEVAPSGSTAEATGLVADVLVGVRILRVESTVGYRDATLTEHLPVLADAQPLVTVPPGARRLHIYQSTLGSASTEWTRWYGSPSGGGVEVGSFPLASRVSGPVELGNATHLRPDADSNDRIFTLVWTIRP